MNNSYYTINTVVLHITTCCSHKCSFCYAIDDSIPKLHQSRFILEKIIIEIVKAGAKEILFVGGDPASHPDVVELASQAKCFGLKTSVLSNTLFFTSNTKEQVIEVFDTIEITVHSPEPNMHNLFCGKDGAYEFAVGNLKSFKSSKNHLGIVYNITPKTFRDILDTIKRIIEVDKVDIDHVVLQRIAPVGRAYKTDNWILSPVAIESVFSQIEQATIKYSIDISLEDTFPLCLVPQEYRRRYIKPCTWGYENCSLDMHGNVSKCCTDPRYVLGNILEKPLLDLWNTNSSLAEKRNGKLVPQKCLDCELYVQCLGGCVLASEFNGRLGDPMININGRS